VGTPTSLSGYFEPGYESVSCSSTLTCSTVGIAEKDQTERIIVAIYGPPTPSLTEVSPDSSTTTGGLRISLYGSHLSPAPIVRFGSHSATHVTILSNGELQATLPPGIGRVAVRVITPWGTSNGEWFNYARRSRRQAA
jgi:hypothetical protein